MFHDYALYKFTVDIDIASYVTVTVSFDVCRSGVSLQHSQSASPPDVQLYSRNLGLSVERDRQLQTAAVPEHVSVDHARHPHVTRAPEPPPAYDGVLSSCGRARNHPASVTSENGVSSPSPREEKRMVNQRSADRSMSARPYDGSERMSASPNVSASAQFTSDISLASSNVTTYEDNGRQKVCLSADLFDVIRGFYRPWKVLKLRLLRFPSLERPGKGHTSWKTPGILK